MPVQVWDFFSDEESKRKQKTPLLAEKVEGPSSIDENTESQEGLGREQADGISPYMYIAAFVGVLLVILATVLFLTSMSPHSEAEPAPAVAPTSADSVSAGATVTILPAVTEASHYTATDVLIKKYPHRVWTECLRKFPIEQAWVGPSDMKVIELGSYPSDNGRTYKLMLIGYDIHKVRKTIYENFGGEDERTFFACEMHGGEVVQLYPFQP